MSIKGLTDRGLAFPQIGNIRKGSKVKGKTKEGKEYERPIDLQYFKVDIDAQETAAALAFMKVYGDKPTQLNIWLPFDDIKKSWDPFCEAYIAGRMIARSDGDHFLFRADLETHQVVVAEGINIETGEIEPHREVLGMAGRTKVKCKPVGRLKVIIPELQRAAYLVVHTGSIIDIRNISEQLAGIAYIFGGHIKGVPMVIRRRPKMISTPMADGTRSRVEKWMLSIECDPTYMQLMMEATGRSWLPASTKPALPAVAESQALEEGEGDSASRTLEVSGTIEGEWENGEAPEETEQNAPPAPQPAPANSPSNSRNGTQAPQTQPPPKPPSQGQNNAANGQRSSAGRTEKPWENAERPWPPRVLGAWLQFIMRKYAEQKVKPSAATIKMIAPNMELLFAGDENSTDKRHGVAKWLTGKSTSADLTDNEILALRDWLDIKKDSGGAYFPSAMAVKEAQSIWSQYLIDEGQETLPEEGEL